MPGGPAAYVTCGSTENYYVDGPHFNPNPPTTTFFDPDSTVSPNQCGDLIFQNRTRSLTSIYASGSEDESPWKYWWRRARRAQDGAAMDLTEVRKVSRAVDVPDTATIPMWLSDQYDAIGAVLILEDDGTVLISQWGETAFAGQPGPWDGGLNISVQHWARITPPVLNSITRSGRNVTLAWTNRHQGRSIDSTNIYRNNTWLRTVGPTDTNYVDPNLGSGLYTYTLKHLSIPAAPLGPPPPNSAASNALQITLGTACAYLVESSSYTSTLQLADQYLSAGCSEGLGPNKRYRWQPDSGAAWLPWTADTLFDFAGHVPLGTRRVMLQDSNITTHQTSKDTLTFAVSSGQVVLSGPTFIPDKKVKTYSAQLGGSPHAGQWFERYDDGPQWFPATAYEQTSMTRIWPMGEYTVDLRQHKYTGVLRRGRLFIEVCSSPSCSGPAIVGGSLPGPDPTVDWGLFGAGPWIAWGPPDGGRALRLYDLWGMHDRESAFGSAQWIEEAGGGFTDPETGWALVWTRRDLGLTDARAVELAVAGGGARRYVFGMAVDPDLGPNAADDVASYDVGRGLVLVADRERAVGFLLRRGSRNALSSVQEYGVGRFAPTIEEYAAAAQRAAGVHLVRTRRDVQLVLSSEEATGATTWLFVLIRGDSPASVRATADAVLQALR